MDRRRSAPLCIGLGALALMLGCSNQNGGTEGSGTGGVSTTSGSGGDARGSGGNGSGGSLTGTGGSITGTGGSQTGTGGASTGGAPGGAGAGGVRATGGVTGTGGTASGGKAGAAGTGGALATGGSPGTGGGGAGSPGGTSVCGSGAENASVTVTCPTGQTIDKITFASFGTPTGSCGSFATGSCNASSSMAVVQALCVGRTSCSVPANNGAFTDPCDKTTKSLSIQATCTVGGGMEPPAAGQQPFKGFAGDPTACADMQHLGVSWYYNWKQTPTSGCAGTNVPFVPMIWGHSNEVTASAITSAVSSFVSKSYGYVLGFNEPDNSTQSNITVATAVSLWPSFNNSAIQLGTPATQANSTGQTWFTSFMGSVNGSTTLHADFIAIHWYGWNAGSCDAAASQLESYIKYAEGFSGNRPIWLTEWGCLNDSAPDVPTVVNFYNGALAVFARHPRVARYSWYPWSTNLDLVNSDGTLTTLGTAYSAAPAYK